LISLRSFLKKRELAAMNLSRFSDPVLAEKLLEKIRTSAFTGDRIRIMEVCGTHTMEIGRLGLRSLLPSNIELVSGPGCPVCVTPGAYIDAAVDLALNKKVRIVSYGDMIRVPGDTASLAEAKGKGANIEVVTSPLHALEIARAHPEEEIVFLAVGFETTAPATARAVMNAHEADIGNLTFFLSHRTVPPALRALIQDKDIAISGFMLPGHVSAIIGEAPYQFIVKYGIPGVITGFEPIDILLGIMTLCTLITEQTPKIVNAYSRIVKKEGNPLAVGACEKVFRPAQALWRGIGIIPGSGLVLRDEFARFDASIRYGIPPDEVSTSGQPQGCSCGNVLKGVIKPIDCPLFGATCTPRTPVGPCMVSSEGSCAAYYKYGAS
jgi:hydrogenase expression/formation protein HypD